MIRGLFRTLKPLTSVTLTMKNLTNLLLTGMLCLLATACFSQTIFTGANGTNWSDAGNWSNGLPALDNNGFIPSGLSFTNATPINITGAIENHGTINNSGVMIIETGSAIYNYGSFVNAGTIYNFGAIFGCNGSYIGLLPNINELETTDCQLEEVCDGIDNDQDGQIDESCGCTNPAACNFVSQATSDDGSCEFSTCQVCTGQMACNYNPLASIDDGSCEYSSCAGCTYLLAPEYNPAANIDDGSCSPMESCSCPADINQDEIVNMQDLLLFFAAYGSTCNQ